MEWVRAAQETNVSGAGLGHIMMENKNAAFCVQMEPSKMRKDKSHANLAHDQKILEP